MGSDTRQTNARAAGFRRGFHRTLQVLYFATFAVMLCKLLFPLEALQAGYWPEMALLLTATASTLSASSLQLPMQNVLLAAVVIALVGAIAQSVGTLTGIPFGPFVYTEMAGPSMFGILPWWVPLIWVVVILSSRGVARLILRPWRKLRVYGLWLIGLTAALSLILDLALEPFATRVNGFWLWQHTKIPVDWHGTPPTHFIAWTALVSLVLAFVTPVLINKSPRSSPRDYQPFLVWTSLHLLFVISALKGELWLAGAAGIAFLLVVLAFAVRGARW
jgi:uncharacterized membrane protein